MKQVRAIPNPKSIGRWGWKRLIIGSSKLKKGKRAILLSACHGRSAKENEYSPGFFPRKKAMTFAMASLLNKNKRTAKPDAILDVQNSK
jgi:hypothetical protein